MPCSRKASMLPYAPSTSSRHSQRARRSASSGRTVTPAGRSSRSRLEPFARRRDGSETQSVLRPRRCLRRAAPAPDGVDGPREAHHRVASEPRQRGVELGLGRRPADERDPLGALDRGQRRRVRIVGDRPAREAALQDREQHRRIGEGRVEQGRQCRGSDVDRAHVRPSGRGPGSSRTGSRWDRSFAVGRGTPSLASRAPVRSRGRVRSHPFRVRVTGSTLPLVLAPLILLRPGTEGEHRRAAPLALRDPARAPARARARRPRVRRCPQRPLGRRREGQRRAPDRRLEVRRRRRPSMSRESPRTTPPAGPCARS